MTLNRIVIIVSLIFLFIYHHTVAQQNTFDSLSHKLRSFTSNDTNYINTLSAFGIHYQHKNSDSMLLIGDRIIKLSTQIYYAKGLGDGHKIKGIAYINLQNKALALYNDSMALTYYLSINYIKGIGSVYNNMAVLFNSYGEYHSANIFYNKSIKFRRQINDQKGIADCYNNLGNNLSNVGNYNEAIVNMLKGLTIREQMNDKEGIGNSYSNLGNIYYYMGNFKKAEESFWKSYSIRKSIGSENELSNLYINIGTLHYDKKNYDSAYYYYKTALKIGKLYNDLNTIIIALGNIAELYQANNKFDNVLKTINELEKYVDLTIDNENKIIFLVKKSLYFSGTKHNKMAIQYATMAFNTAIKTESKKAIGVTSDNLSKIYEKNGSPLEALTYFKLSKKYEDSIYNDQNLAKFNDFEYRYKLQGKEKEILKLEALSKLETEANNKLKLGFTLLIAVLAGVSGLTYYINRNRKKEIYINELNVKQKQTLEQHNIFKDKVFSIIAHDLRAPVANLQSIFKMLEDDLISIEEFMFLKKGLNDQVGSLGLLLDNLLIWAKNQMNSGFKTNITTVSINKLVAQNQLLFAEIANKKEITIEIKINNQINLEADADQLDLIIRNLLSNAIKFTNNKGTVSVTANQTDDNIILKVKDNGIGMDKETIDHIYANNIVSKQGTNGEKGTGLGINLTSEFIKNNNGTFTICSKPNIGTEIIIEFKKLLALRN